jgi:uncharacterized membrane protein
MPQGIHQWWIERIPEAIEEIIRLEGGNETLKVFVSASTCDDSESEGSGSYCAAW